MLLLRVGRCSQRRFSTVRSKVDFGDGIILRKVSSEGDPKPIALVCGWMAANNFAIANFAIARLRGIGQVSGKYMRCGGFEAHKHSETYVGT